MAADRHVQIGHDAQGNAIITGDHGRAYVFPSITELSPELLAQLDGRASTLQDEPTAVPLPSLILRIAYDNAQHTTWIVTPAYPNAEGTSYTVPVPWHTQPSFSSTLAEFWELSRHTIADAGELQAIHHQALALGETLGTVLTEADRELLETRGRDDGPPPLLIIESADEATLSLPWELLRLHGRYAVHDGRLDIARCVPAPGAPHLARPTAPVTLLVTIAAPEQSGLDYEAESYYITRALHDHVGVVVNEMGELDDLVRALCGEPAPLGVHFSCHGGPGQLVFEDEFGGGRTVNVEEMLDAIRHVAPERLPRFFYLACCHGGDAPVLSGDRANRQSGLSATATALHRESVSQVVAYFGPVYDRQSTLAETAFYTEIARGRRTRDAVRAARLVMARPFLPLERETARDVPVLVHDGTTPFAWAQLMFYHRGPDYPLGIAVPPKYAMTVEAPPAREEKPVFISGRSHILHKGFIGRRTDLHALRRDLHRGHNVHVVQGLGGLGKTAFCYEALKLYKRQGRDVLALWCAEIEQDAEPVSALLRQLSEQATALIGEAWEAIVADVDHLAMQQPAVPRPAIRLTTLLRALLRRQGQPPLVLYLDNLESLLSGPDNDDGEAIVAWRDPEAEALWRELARIAQTSGGRLALLASCRYRNPDFGLGRVPFGRLPDDAVWRMLGWFQSIRRLSATSRTRLVAQLAGHPRAVTWLDALLSHAMIEWEARHGRLPEVPTAHQAQHEWDALVAPVLPSLTQRLSEDLLFKALWERVLDGPARSLLVRATVLRRPAEWLLLRALIAEEAEETADAAIRRVRDASLLTEGEEYHGSNGAASRFEVHPTVRRFLILRGQACADLGSLSRALPDFRQAVEICERLAQHDPENAEWQTDVVVSYWKLAQNDAMGAEDHVDTRALLERGLTILYRLRDGSRLTSTQEDWIMQFERALQPPSPPQGIRRLLGYGSAWLRKLAFR